MEEESPHWIYRYERPERPGKWIKMLPTEESVSEMQIPAARYAHQVVYDPVAKTVYMHGGNSRLGRELEDEVAPPPRPDSAGEGRSESSETRTQAEAVGTPDDTQDDRLDDFWAMTLVRYVEGSSPLNSLSNTLFLQAVLGKHHPSCTFYSSTATVSIVLNHSAAFSRTP